MKLAVFLSFLAVLFTTGCWNKDYNEPGKIETKRRPTELVVNSGFQRTWKATQTVLAKFPISQKKINRSTGQAFITTDWIEGKSDILYHGYDVNRVPYIIRYKLHVLVMSDRKKGGTRVIVKGLEQYKDDVVTAGVDFQGSVHTWIKTNSSTHKENALLVQINKLVDDPKFLVQTSSAPVAPSDQPRLSQ